LEKCEFFKVHLAIVKFIIGWRDIARMHENRLILFKRKKERKEERNKRKQERKKRSKEERKKEKKQERKK